MFSNFKKHNKTSAMKKLLIFIGFIISQNASAQLILQWQANFGGSAVESMTNSEIGTSNILKTNDGGFILAGSCHFQMMEM